MITTKVQAPVLDELLVKAGKIGQEGQVALVGAEAVADLVRRHLFNLDAEQPNKLGGPRTHFFYNAAKSVEQPKLSGAEAKVRIPWTGLAQRWLGGHIEAGAGTSSSSGGPTKYLAIPARAEAYGKTPGEFDDLQFVKLKGDRAMLVQAMQTQFISGKKLKNGQRDYSTVTVGGLVMFWLVTSVDQAPDPHVMPAESEMVEAARYHMDNYLSRQLASN